MDTNRRSFLRGLFTVAAAANITTPADLFAAPDVPILWADGINDDSPALNALVRGLRIDIKNDLVRCVTNGHYFEIRGCNYLLGSTLEIPGKTRGLITNCIIRSSKDFEGDCLINILGDPDSKPGDDARPFIMSSSFIGKGHETTLIKSTV